MTAHQSLCQRCGVRFYRPGDDDIASSHVRIDAPPAVRDLIVAQAPYYCDDCLEALFPRHVATRLDGRSDFGTTGGGRWVNPHRGVTR